MCISHTLNNVGARIEFSLSASFMTPWLELVGGHHPHRGAQALECMTVHPTRAPGHSNFKWYATAEIQFVLADHFHKLEAFLDHLDDLSYDDATRRKLHGIILDVPGKAAMLARALASRYERHSAANKNFLRAGGPSAGDYPCLRSCSGTPSIRRRFEKRS